MPLHLHLSDYLGRGEQFHFARSKLSSGTKPQLHDHDFFELFWVDTGQVRHRVADKVLVLEAGMVCFIRPADVHALQAHRGVASIVNVAFKKQTVEFLKARHGPILDGTSFWLPQAVPEHRQLGPLAHRTLAAWGQRLDASGRGQLALDAFLLAVLGLLVHDDPLPEGADNAPPWLQEACRALVQPQTLRAGVSGFVQVAGRDPAHVSRACKRHIGKTPSLLVREARLALAARLLTASDQPIMDIAMDVGLPNLSHFYTQFKSRFGQTPRAYRLDRRSDIVVLGR